jgi:hypothetical protein
MIRSRILVVVLMLWGIAMIAPDLVRVAQPLGSFGFYANNDGLIYDVTGPFPDEASSPAWRAGIREGDQLDLLRLECNVREPASCGNALALVGGLEFVLPGRSATLPLAATGTAPARDVTLVAVQRPSNFLIRAVVMLDQIAGVLVVVAAGWLVWIRPSAMSWGFFLYANWFNPGQVYAFYAILEQWPPLLIAQDAAASIAEAAGYAGLLLFCLRVPNNETESEWRPIERALPYVALLFALLLLASYGSLFGYRTETMTRAVILAGFVVDFWALGILLARRRNQTPEDYQRVRWVIWGCLIGLPSFLVAELASNSSSANSGCPSERRHTESRTSSGTGPSSIASSWRLTSVGLSLPRSRRMAPGARPSSAIQARTGWPDGRSSVRQVRIATRCSVVMLRTRNVTKSRVAGSIHWTSSIAASTGADEPSRSRKPRKRSNRRARSTVAVDPIAGFVVGSGCTRSGSRAESSGPAGPSSSRRRSRGVSRARPRSASTMGR